VLIHKSMFTKYVMDVTHPALPVITPSFTYLFAVLVNYFPDFQADPANTR